MCNVAISTVLMYCFVTLVRLSLVTNKGYLLTYLLTYCVVPYDAEQTASSRRRATFYDLRKHHIDALAAAFNECNWSSVSEITDVDLAYERFLCIAETLVSLHIPQHTQSTLSSCLKIHQGTVPQSSSPCSEREIN